MADYSNWTQFDARFETDCSTEPIPRCSRDLHVSKKFTRVACYNFDIHEPIVIIFWQCY